METQSENVASFLQALQTVMAALGQHWSYFRRRGAAPQRPYLSLSGNPFTVHGERDQRIYRGSIALGLLVDGPTAKGLELGIDVMWDDNKWTIATEAWVDAAEGGQRLLRALPERVAFDLPSCIAETLAAVESLRDFEDLVFGGA